MWCAFPYTFILKNVVALSCWYQNKRSESLQIRSFVCLCKRRGRRRSSGTICNCCLYPSQIMVIIVLVLSTPFTSLAKTMTEKSSLATFGRRRRDCRRLLACFSLVTHIASASIWCKLELNCELKWTVLRGNTNFSVHVLQIIVGSNLLSRLLIKMTATITGLIKVCWRKTLFLLVPTKFTAWHKTQRESGVHRKVKC